VSDERDPSGALPEIERLLDERMGREGEADLTVVQRVSGVIGGFHFWQDLAIRRLHEIHQLKGEPCPCCPERHPSGPVGE
jgi:hypothetical protein